MNLIADLNSGCQGTPPTSHEDGELRQEEIRVGGFATLSREARCVGSSEVSVFSHARCHGHCAKKLHEHELPVGVSILALFDALS